MMNAQQILEYRREFEEDAERAAEARDYLGWVTNITAVNALDRVLGDTERLVARERIPYPKDANPERLVHQNSK